MSRRTVYIKMLNKNNKSKYAEYQYPRIYPGYKTQFVDCIEMCASGWHYTTATKKGLEEWYEPGDKVYVVVPEGNAMKAKYCYKYCCQQLIFVGLIKIPKDNCKGSYTKYLNKRLAEIKKQGNAFLDKWYKKHPIKRVTKKGGK